MPIRKVTDPSILAQLNQGGNVVAANPMFPGQMQQQQATIARTQQEIQQGNATLPYAAPKAAADASNAATQAQVNAATAPSEIAQKQASARKTDVEAKSAEQNFATTGGANEGQSKSASFYTRAARANQLFEGTGIKDDPMGREVAKAVLPDGLVNKFTSPDRQKAEAAQRDFIAATLRYESGANIPQNEFDLQKSIYFPAPGDDPSTVALKASLRKNALDGLRVASGPAAPLLDQQSARRLGTRTRDGRVDLLRSRRIGEAGDVERQRTVTRQNAALDLQCLKHSRRQGRAPRLEEDRRFQPFTREGLSQ